ncbi:TonB-dependent receptor [Mucilaginibacter ginsenosidivorans]|uniref:TonB-dependent receptor n=1 Tax=Mucilaginibacter ginsenosidivorans TaxID=398053 RepID=A0A5B8UUJ2_9SPHI|nr:TonB-dependent receptor [Mucilaginibacter ginsenosidivorans]QEC62096.1 TonB-dependent receptor [Mucilaginibacter ginsenosidivorans]
MKKTFLFFLFFITLNHAFSQSSGNIKGSITDNKKTPLELVNIILYQTNFRAITNNKGQYSIDNIPAGNYQIIISHIGYQSVKQHIIVKNHETAEFSYPLQDSVIKIPSVEVQGERNAGSITTLPEIGGTNIYSGKKIEVILVDSINADIAQSKARDMFAKVPGITSWELDGSGTQTSVAARGLNPHRSWEFNVNQNGYNVNNDLYGYPEAMYNPPLEAVQQIEIIRGSAALQYGPQFGGMLNYVIKQPDTTRSLSIETEQTYGSFNTSNSFASAGGKKGKFTYYAFFNYRSSDGWRLNSNYNFLNAYASLHYKPTDKMDIGLEYSRENYVQKFAGGLTDAMFAADPRQSTRSRNYFNPILNVPALSFNYAINNKTQLNVKAYTLFGQRNMVIASPGLATNADTISKTTGSYAPREINRDFYNSYTVDARMIKKYDLFGHESALSGGLKYSSAATNRKQNGEGTTGTNFDLTQTGNYGIALLFKTINYGAFLENLFRITDRLSVTPGIRYDNLNSTLNGTEYKVYKNFNPVSLSTTRNIVLGGIGAQYKITQSINIYANYSQAYRPILYSNLIIGSSTAVIDPDLKDASGHNADIGIRGKVKNILNFDLSAFELKYNNRIGNITLTDANGEPYTYTTNAGNALTKGVEAFFELHLLNFDDEQSNNDLSIFSSYAYNHARYLNGKTGAVDLTGKTLEDVPQFVSRSGINGRVHNITATFYYSYVGGSWSDANNTVATKTSPNVGYVPRYGVADFALGYKFSEKYNIRIGVNNLTDNKYFTRRTETLVYVGNGILPGDGRSCYVTLGAKF